MARLRRSYGPLRRPRRPRRALAGCGLGGTALHRVGLPVLQPVSSCVHAAATTPAGPLGASLVSPSVIGLPRISGGSAPASPFSRPAQRSLALRPARSPSRLATLCTEGFSRFVASATAPIATGRSDSCQAGFAPAEDRCLFTAHWEMRARLVPEVGGPCVATRPGCDTCYYPGREVVCKVSQFGLQPVPSDSAWGRPWGPSSPILSDRWLV